MNATRMLIALLTVLLLVAAGKVMAQEDRSYIDARSASDQNVPPFSGAVKVGDTTEHPVFV